VCVRVAVGMLLDIIRQAPNVSDPYHTLGLIYETMNDKKKALEFFMIAAHISPKDAPLWRRLGLMSREVGNPPTRAPARWRLHYSHPRHSQGNTEQAIYCYSKAIRLDPNDCDAIWDRSVIYAEQGKHDKGSVVLQRRVSFQLSCFLLTFSLLPACASHSHSRFCCPARVDQGRHRRFQRAGQGRFLSPRLSNHTL
jgi:tetratricopeptide (TPR) repeat protein